jgi:ABC-type uncharacterized transport system permease subunit
MWAGFVLHTLALVARGVSLARCPIRNLYEATTFLLWTIAAAYLVVGMLRRVRFLGVFVAPLMLAVGIFALMPALDSPEAGSRMVPGWRSLHATFILLAYGAFGLGALTGGMYLMESDHLKNHKARALASLLPPRQMITLGRRLLAPPKPPAHTTLQSEARLRQRACPHTPVWTLPSPLRRHRRPASAPCRRLWAAMTAT